MYADWEDVISSSRAFQRFVLVVAYVVVHTSQYDRLSQQQHVLLREEIRADDMIEVTRRARLRC